MKHGFTVNANDEVVEYVNQSVRVYKENSEIITIGIFDEYDDHLRFFECDQTLGVYRLAKGENNAIIDAEFMIIDESDSYDYVAFDKNGNVIIVDMIFAGMAATIQINGEKPIHVMMPKFHGKQLVITGGKAYFDQKIIVAECTQNQIVIAAFDGTIIKQFRNHFNQRDFVGVSIDLNKAFYVVNGKLKVYEI